MPTNETLVSCSWTTGSEACVDSALEMCVGAEFGLKWMGKGMF